MNVAADLARLAGDRGWSSAPAFHDAHRTWTHGEVHELAARVATVLGEQRVRPGDRVLLALPDGIGWVVAFLAIARAGAIAVLVNPGLPRADHEFIADDCAAALCLTGAELRDHFAGRHWTDIDHLLARAAGAQPAPAWPGDDRSPLYLQYTSGTTGEPKGVVHHQGDLRIYHDAVASRVLGVRPADVTLSVSKLFFAYGFGNAFVFPLFSGSSAVLLADRPTPDLIMEAVARHRVTLLYAVPSAYAALVDRAEPAAFASVRAAVSAGESLPTTLGERTTVLVGAPVCEQLGSTEAGHAFCANSPDDNVPGTVGRMVPGYEVRLRDRQGGPVPDGEPGELWVRGPTLLREYLNRPAETAQALVDGWLGTRDLVRRRPDGTFQHLGRVDDMEMVGGITVSPAEVERLFAEHPLVREVAVAAVPDQLGATKLRAFVVPAGPVADPAGFETELIGLARGRLASFKVPRTVRAVSHLPRTATGKLRRHIVRTGAW
jgi:fatty acid CoA ligase FadD22